LGGVEKGRAGTRTHPQGFGAGGRSEDRTKKGQ